MLGRCLRGSWFLVAVLALALCADLAEAKPRKRHRKRKADKVVATTTNTSLRAKPGEAAKVVVRISSGTKVRVLDQKGRWLRVEAKGKRGWITRTTVESEVRTSSRRKRGSRWGGRARTRPSDATAVEPAPIEAEVSADGAKVRVLARRAAVYARPSARSLVAFRVSKGDVLVVAGDAKRRRWLLVDAGRGRTGWIAAAAVADAGAGAAAAVAAAADADADADAVDAAVHVEDDEHIALDEPAVVRVARPLPRFALRGAADLGVRSLGMDFTSDLQAGLGNYIVSTQAATVGAGGDLRWQVGSRLVVGADVDYRLTHAAPGIRYESSAGAMGDIAFSSHEVDGGARLGVRFGDRTSPVDVYARGGAHYEVFIVDQLDNVGRLPNEALSGATAGIGLDIPRFDSSSGAGHAGTIGIAVRVDMLLGGRRGQTAGLEDGAFDSASALWARASVAYRLSENLDLSALYQHARIDTTWTGPSVRVANVDGAERRDRAHTFVLGVRAGL